MQIKGSISHFMFTKPGVWVHEENLLSVQWVVCHLLNHPPHSRAWHSSRHRMGTWYKCLCRGKDKVKKEEVLYTMFQKHVL